MSDPQRSRMTKSDAIASRVLLWVFAALFVVFATLITARAAFATRLVPRSVEVALEVLALVVLVAQRVFFQRMKRRAEESAAGLFKNGIAPQGGPGR